MRQHALAWAAIFSLVLCSVALRATEAAASAPAPEPTPVLIVPYDGQPALVTKVPPEIPRGEVQQMGEAQEQSFKAVASGEVDVAEATRDPAQSPDPGSGLVFWLLAALFGGIVRPPVDYMVERSRLDDRLGGAVHVGVMVAFYLGLWALLHASYPSLPQDWTSWLIAAGLGGGAGAGAQSAIRAAQGRSGPPPAAAREPQEGRP